MTTDDVPDTDLEHAWHWSLVQEFRSALTVVAILGFLAGGVFPLGIVGLGGLLFPDRAHGSLLRDGDGQVLGSKLIGQGFSGSQYFHPRPSGAGADGYDSSASSGLNLGPTNPNLYKTIAERSRAYRFENGLAADVALPADAVTTSASGLDPHISPANAFLQVARVAKARGLPEARVRSLVESKVESRTIGVLGEPRVNVLALNLALDGLSK